MRFEHFIVHSLTPLLSLAFIHAGRESYYSNLAKEDYYTKEQEYQGVFLGSGAKEAGIYGQAISDRDTTLSCLFKGEERAKKSGGDSLK